ncbi:MAG: molybdopterin-dependent oxidoreductase [Proteobacteria bacterium]|nr:molybdopterin-dependent oxidoreductase [Pseudomonadota bacterium]
MNPTRRTVVTSLLSSLLVGCKGDDEGDTADSSADGLCPAALSGASFDRILGFSGEADRPLEQSTGDGLDRRYVVDLSTLDPSSLVLPLERFYVRTGEPDQIEPTAWSIAVSGLATDSSFTLADHSDLIEDTGPIYLECSGNSAYGGFGLMSAAAFSGMAIDGLLDRLGVQATATQVRVDGFDTHSQASSGSTEGASWVFSLADLREGWLVTHMNGEPLDGDHGAPVRLLIPQWWGCAMIKWVNAMVFVDDSEPATSQMQEFAQRTHQPGSPALAVDYIAATRDPTAAPVRVERWVDGDRVLHRIIGLYWGPAVDGVLWQIRIGDGEWQPVDFCLARTSPHTWGLWEKVVEGVSGEQAIRLRVDDADVRTRRLDSEWYRRTAVFA